MTAEIVEINSCKKDLAVELPATELEQEIDKIAREYSRNAKVPGFRPGKVPLSVIRQRYGKDMRQEAMEEVARILPQGKTEILSRDVSCEWGALTLRYFHSKLQAEK